MNYLFDKYYNRTNETLNIDIKNYKKVPDSKSINITKNVPLEQSYIYLEYKIINFKEDDIDYFKIITDLLNDQSTDLLFKKLRIEKRDNIRQQQPQHQSSENQTLNNARP